MDSNPTKTTRVVRARRNSSHRTHRARALLAVAALALSVLTATGAASMATVRPSQRVPTASSSSAAIPERIISLSPTATEMLFAIGAGKQVVAVDDDSDYPKNAPRTSLSGLEPNVEAIAKYRPDLVVVSYNPSGFAAKLASLKIPVLIESAPTEVSGTYSQITALGKATGHLSAARSLVRTMRKKIAAIVAKTPHFKTPVTYYFELDQTYYSATSSTFIGQLLKLLGLVNIADAAPDAAGGYPQLSSEYIVKANPQMILLADTICCHINATVVAHRPGWSVIGAVRDGAVVGLNDDIASRWGPRIVNLLATVESRLVALKTRLGSS